MMKPVPAPRRGPSRSRSAAAARTDRGCRAAAVPSGARTRVAARRGVDVDDGRVEPLGDVGKRDDGAGSAGGHAGGATLRRPARAAAPTIAGAGVIEPATTRPTRNATVALRHTVTRPGTAGSWQHYRTGLRTGSGVSARSAIDRSTDRAPERPPRRASARRAAAPCRPCCPASAPTITAVVFLLTDPATLPPSRSSAAVACSRVIDAACR